MAKLLIVDGNPDSQRLLGGLLKYRTRHTFVRVASCTDGARKAISASPDVILINALLFMQKNFAFPRVLQQHEKTAGISFLVHATGRLGQVTRRQIEASGVAAVLELPLSADELEAEIQAALKRRPKRPGGAGVQKVQWQRVEAPPKKEGRSVQPVQWPGAPAQAQKRSRQPVSKSGSARFQPLSENRPEAAGPKIVQNKKRAFRPAQFPRVTGSELDRVKGTTRGDFEAQTWEEIDPEAAKQGQPKQKNK